MLSATLALPNTELHLPPPNTTKTTLTLEGFSIFIFKNKIKDLTFSK
jgi:hypothetical protein